MGMCHTPKYHVRNGNVRERERERERERGREREREREGERERERGEGGRESAGGERDWDREHHGGAGKLD